MQITTTLGIRRLRDWGKAQPSHAPTQPLPQIKDRTNFSAPVHHAPQPEIQEFKESSVPPRESGPRAPSVITTLEPPTAALSQAQSTAPEPVTTTKEIAQTASFMATLLGPRLGPKMLDASSLVTIAGLRGSNFHSLPCSAPTGQEQNRMNQLNKYLANKGLRVTHDGKQLKIDNLSAIARLAQQRPEIPEFDATTGWDGLDQWEKRVWQDRDDVVSQTRLQGILLGYPTRAIDDGAQIYSQEKRDYGLIGTVRVPYSQSICLDVDLENLSHPEIRRWQAQWGETLGEVYRDPALAHHLGPREGQLEPPSEFTAQDSSQQSHLALKSQLPRLSNLARAGATYAEAKRALETSVGQSGGDPKRVQTFDLLYAGEKGREPYSQFAQIVKSRPDWESAILKEKAGHLKEYTANLHRQMSTAPRSWVDYDTLLAQSAEELSSLNRRIGSLSTRS